MLKGAAGVRGNAQAATTALAVDMKILHARFGELTLANDISEGVLGYVSLFIPLLSGSIAE